MWESSWSEFHFANVELWSRLFLPTMPEISSSCGLSLSFQQMVICQVGDRGVLTGDEKHFGFWGEMEKHFERDVMTLNTDIHLTFINIRGLISSGQDYFSIPSPVLPLVGSHSCWLLLWHAPSRRAVFIPSKTPWISPACGVTFWLLSLTSGALQELTFTCLSEFVSLKLLQSLDLPVDSEIGTFTKIPYSGHFTWSCVTCVGDCLHFLYIQTY